MILPYVNNKKEQESPIGQYRVSTGYTIKELCEQADTKVAYYSALQNGTTSPMYLIGKKIGELKPWVKSILHVLGISPEEAFPRYICRIGSNDLTNEQILDMSTGWDIKYSPDKLYDDKELKTIINEALNTLTDIEKDVICKRFGIGYEEESLDNIAIFYGVSRERVRQIEFKALRKLRHPERSKKLKYFKKT